MRYPPYIAVQDCRGKILSVVFSDGDMPESARHPEEAGWKINSAGVRKAGKEARLTLWYARRQHPAIHEAVRAMLQPLGIVVSVAIGKLETVERHMHANPYAVWLGKSGPDGTLPSLQRKAVGGIYNPGYYSNPAVVANI